MTTDSLYVGRFAPSPSGPLHFGSLVAALASYLDAKANNGRWLLRIEDLDPPRESARAPAEILKQLRYFGLMWDADVLYQSTRLPAYQDALNTLDKNNQTYPCSCSRKSYGYLYPGTCRPDNYKNIALTSPAAIRLKTRDIDITWHDIVFGHQNCRINLDIGDFIIKRKDGLFAYQLAVVVDDLHQGITHIIRGSDLLDSTPKQIFLRRQLSHKDKPLIIGHLPVITGDDGQKLSKQAHAEAISTQDLASTLNKALEALGQKRVNSASGFEMLQAAVNHWNISDVPQQKSISLSTLS